VSTQRLLSLDVMRGLTVIGMVLVNSASVFHYGSGAKVWGPLLHAPWAGITIADLVFPFFIFMVGVSIPFALSSLKEREGLTGSTALRISKRGLILFAIGLMLTLSFANWDAPIRLLGVLQRIGLTFVIASLLFMACSWRVLLGIALMVLVAYDPATLIAIPDAETDYLVPGQNFSSWLDRALLGAHVYNPTIPLPFEPEGLLGTLPSVAQAILGILTGLWLKTSAGKTDILRPVWLAAAVMLVIGLTWALLFPPVKAIWSASFVWITSGLGLMLLAALYWWLDIKKAKLPGATLSQAFGINAITGYVIHTYLMGPMLNNSWNFALYDTLTGFMAAEIASLPSFLLVIIASWAPVAIMQKHGIILKV
jgi:predicted acyltransferase